MSFDLKRSDDGVYRPPAKTSLNASAHRPIGRAKPGQLGSRRLCNRTAFMTKPAQVDPSRSFQGLILTLQHFWAEQGCVILQPYDMQMGVKYPHRHYTCAPRALPWNAAYVQPSPPQGWPLWRKPPTGSSTITSSRSSSSHRPTNIQQLYLDLLAAIGLDARLHDIRFVEDDWESPTLGAWGLGWECWCDGMEVSQFTYFQQVAGFECNPVAGELTYGLERLAMYLQGVDNGYELNFNGGEGDAKVTYGDVFRQNEQEFSRYNFEAADTDMLFRHFADAETGGRALLDKGQQGDKHLLAVPACEQVIKASHAFNLLADARGVISVTERQSYILRIRDAPLSAAPPGCNRNGGAAA